MRSRLLSYLYREIDSTPDAASAMVLSHPDGVVWSVANRRLRASTEQGVLLADIDLSTGTVLQAAFGLMNAGVRVSSLNSNFINLRASILIDGSGSERSYTNVLLGHQSVLWALIDGYTEETQAATNALPRALQQAKLQSSEGEWLEFWGDYFNVARGAGQADAGYRSTIVAETLRAKSNKYAIENAVLDITGSQIEIAEPWQSIFRLDASALSGAHAMHDGVIVGYHLIRPLIPSGSDWDAVMAAIERNKAAGVLVSSPVRVVPALQVVVMPIEPTIWSSRVFDHTFLVGKINTNALGRLVLDGYPSAINHLTAIFSLSSLGNADGANNVQQIAPWRSVAKSSITLSDGYALGDINSVLGRGRIDREIVPGPSLSDALALSDAEVVMTIVRVTEIINDAHGSLLAMGASSEQGDAGLNIAFGFVAMLNTDVRWTGAWSGARKWNDHCIAGMVMTTFA